MFEKVLIANRGEIAVRVAHACHELGLSCVAVYSEPDRMAPHVTAADEAVPIGPAASSESYLQIPKLLEAARRTGATAVHPGYGFLAENPRFASAVAEAGLCFIGPTAEAIEAMGDKTAARRRMRAAGVPVVPGSDAVETAEEALAAARAVGYPVMLKAVAGGGGKGMRVVDDEADLRSAYSRAESEARGAFGDGRLYLERFLTRPRHIEIQILADGTGRAVHLGERECSIQRRHQKLIEEAPSPVLDASTRSRMGEVAIRAAEAVQYTGAGTVEFLYQDEEFFFLEMNTRIQVEHPVTELVTGVDLVKEQIRIASGEALDWDPDPAWPRGHAIECRISAEDPVKGFLPSVGRIERLRPPDGPGVRWDSGIAEGFEVGLHYDPLLAKLIVHAETRAAAIARMRRALKQLRLSGVATTQPFHIAVMKEPDFARGDTSIRYIEEHPELLGPESDRELLDAALAIAVLLEERERHASRSTRDEPSRSDRARGSELSAWQTAFPLE